MIEEMGFKDKYNSTPCAEYHDNVHKLKTMDLTMNLHLDCLGLHELPWGGVTVVALDFTNSPRRVLL